MAPQPPSPSQTAFLADAVAHLQRVHHAEMASILVLDGTRLRHGAAAGLAPGYVAAIDDLEIGPEVGTCGAACFRGSPQVTPDIRTDPRWEPWRELAEEHGLRSCWSVPLQLPDGTVLGTFAVYHDVPYEPPPEELELAHSYAAVVALGLGRLRDLVERLHIDVVTGIASRAAWEDALRAEELHHSRGGRPSSVVILDLDDLKTVNDAEGHQAGDALLRRAGGVLAASVRATDFVARIGGDEFGVLLRYSDEDHAAAWSDRLLGGDMPSCSLGYASMPPATTLAAAVRDADLRMYDAKAAKRRF